MCEYICLYIIITKYMYRLPHEGRGNVSFIARETISYFDDTTNKCILIFIDYVQIMVRAMMYKHEEF